MVIGVIHGSLAGQDSLQEKKTKTQTSKKQNAQNEDLWQDASSKYMACKTHTSEII